MRSIVSFDFLIYGKAKRSGVRPDKESNILQEDIMKKAVLAILVVTIIGAMCLTAVSCKVNTAPTVVECEELTMLMEGKYYVGTEGTVDLSVALPGSEYTITEGSNATIADNVLTVKSAGDFSLKYKPTDTEAENIQTDGTVTLSVSAVEGVNVATWAELVAAVNASKNVVIQNKLVSEGKDSVEVVNTTFYGNAKSVVVNSIVGGTVDVRGGNAFNVANGNKAVFQDIYFYGREYAEGESVVLENCEGYGQIINGISTDNSKRTNITIKHCILENSQKMVYLKGAVDCTVDGTVMRNGADALLAAETCNYDGVNLTVKNSVFANSVVCGIILCGWTEVANEKGYCTLNLEGFVDIYNWKSRTTAKLMPRTEGDFLYKLVNGLVQDELGKSKYDSYFTKGDDGEDYVHFGIVVLATGKLSSNKSKINGLTGSGVQLVKKNFPLPPATKAIVKTCDLYCIDNNNITIKPTETIDDNKALSFELVHGRQY